MKRIFSCILLLAVFFNLALSANAAIIIPDSLLPAATTPPSAPELNKILWDSLSQNTLILPDGWDLKFEEETDKAFVKVNILPKDSSIVIKYQNVDYWSLLDAQSQKTWPRSAVNNAAFTKEQIAELTGVDTENVSTCTINGVEYFWVTYETSVTKYGYTFSMTNIFLIRFQDGYFYTYLFGDNMENSLFEDFINMVGTATYGGSSSEKAEPSDSDIYQDAQSAYNKGKYSEAEKLFEQVSDYKDADKYLRLIKIRSFGGNMGMGTKAYDSCYALTSSQKKEIDKAMNHISFADTAEVLMCNSDVACYFLLGDWYTAAGAPKYGYLQVKTSSAGYLYYRSYSLSTKESGTFSINDGELTIDIFKKCTPTFSIEIQSKDCIELYSYETCRTFTLYRK